MATSGTYSFSMTRDDIAEAALRLLQVYGIGDPIPSAVLSNVAQALNIFCQSLVKRGLFLWCVQDISIPMVAGQAAYQIGPLTGQPRPLRLMDAYLRDSTGNDVGLTITSRYDYDTLGQKSSAGTPNQLFYDPQLSNGIVTLYNVPVDSSHTMHAVIQRPFQDFNAGADNPDFPPEALQMLKWGLADEISLEQGARDTIIDRVATRAARYMEEFCSYQQEQCSVFFTPSQQMPSNAGGSR